MFKACHLIKASLPETLPSLPLGTFSSAQPLLAHDNIMAPPANQIRSPWFPSSAPITKTTRTTHNNFHHLSRSSSLRGSLTPGLRASINTTVADNMLLNNLGMLIRLRKCSSNNTAHGNPNISLDYATNVVPPPVCRSTSGVTIVAQNSRSFSPGSTPTTFLLMTHILLRRLTTVRAPPATPETPMTASCTLKSECPKPLTLATPLIGLQMSGRTKDLPS